MRARRSSGDCGQVSEPGGPDLGAGVAGEARGPFRLAEGDVKTRKTFLNRCFHHIADQLRDRVACRWVANGLPRYLSYSSIA